MEFKDAYDRDHFIDFLQKDFLPDFKKEIRSVNLTNFSSIKKAFYLGESKDLDLQVFEFLFEGSPNKRIALTKDAFTVMRSSAIFNALAVFHSPDNNDWRFSLMTATPEPTEKGKVKLSYSNPKRLSFFLGPNAKTNTPTKFLRSKGKIVDFEDLKSRFSIEVVNKEFYKEISQAFIKLVGESLKLPDKIVSDNISQEFAVRLIGRIIFCWFLREKKSQAGIALMPKDLLSIEAVKKTENYYHKILEPIFFEVLNKPINSRRDDFANEPFSHIAYLNGGLFSPQDDDYYKRANNDLQSQFEKTLTIPDSWFKYFFEILETYNFTIDENTSYDEELSIDPEMLGRIFENLLAEINPETGESARKSTGSYYTPRVIVNYMVDESLLLYLKVTTGINEGKLLAIISYDLNDDIDNPVTAEEKEKIIDALEKVKILDPACGSGAYPIGALQKIVFILQQTDPDGQLWFKKQMGTATPEFRRDIEKKFSNNELDFIRKLGVIRNSIYGIDIQSIATEISRLRCFLTLIVDEVIKDTEENRGVKPLPNLDFKFVTANSLISLSKLDDEPQNLLFDETKNVEKLRDLMDEFFSINEQGKYMLMNAFHQIQKDLIKQYFREKDYSMYEQKRVLSSLGDWNPFTHQSTDWFDPEWMFGIKNGFDIVIGNPPYVSTKGRSNTDKTTLKNNFGFADDLYSHFYFMGLQNTKKGTGVLSYITSKTFWVIQTKKNLRELLQSKTILQIFDTATPFAAMVDTCVVIIRNLETANNYDLSFKDGKKDLLNPINIKVDIEIFRKAVNKVFFIPTKFNLKIYNRYNDLVKKLMDRWWGEISTSSNIAKHQLEIEQYRQSLKPGGVTLLGLITDGGVGLETANNGRFIGVRENLKQAHKIASSRPIKLFEAVSKYKIKELSQIQSNSDSIKFIGLKKEEEIQNLFDKLKEKYGVNIFGKGYIYKIISDNVITSVNKLTEEEETTGISRQKPFFVAYDKGDRDGNRWYSETPFVIDWSKESVRFLQENSGKKAANMPVFRSPKFYFREGFSWNLINGTRTTNDLKFKISTPAVNDMAANKLTSLADEITNKYIVAVCNSSMINQYTENFINFTVNFPHNSTRQIPIVIPTKLQLNEFEDLFDRAYKIKRDQFSGLCSKDKAEILLQQIQKELDEKVLKLYDLIPEEVKT